jgi:pimeloyl-ACP methyl ester carboxylesterase
MKFRKLLRTVWILAGLGFFAWIAYSFQSRGLPVGVLESDSAVTVTNEGGEIRFQPAGVVQGTGIVFFPGGMVDPRAYAPLARRLAEAGYPVIIVRLPFRTASFPGQEEEVYDDTRAILANGETQWVIAGHSRGAAISGRFAYAHPDLPAGLVLVGTSHPKEPAYDLSGSAVPVLKIYATNDGLASPGEVLANAGLLPADTEWVEIVGGNHAQFGYYGAQLGDGRAEITREAQQDLTFRAILDFLETLVP